MGDGYKSLCENMGGVYLDGETLRFNPFANITDIDQSAERVRDQLSVMASPNGNLDEVHEGLLLQAVRASWLAKENRARIDDVVDFLKNASDSEQYAGSPTIRSRLDEMIVLLDQYTANGTYGQYFNSDEPSCGMMRKWWCWSWATGRPSVTAGCGDVLPDYLHREQDVPHAA